MRIKYITEDGLLFLKNNKSVVYKELFEAKKNLMDVLNDSSYVKETQYEIGDLTLATDLPVGKETLTDAENVQRVYSHMKSLSDSQASDERIWVAYTLLDQKDYMLYRWPAKDADDMLNRYFFNYSVQRSLFRNGMARLWWIGRVTYDDKRTDPFELTKFICRDQDFIETICGRNIFNSLSVLKSTVSALFDAEKSGIQLPRELIRGVGKYVNLLAGTYIIDAMGPEMIYQKVSNYIRTYKGE